MRALVGDIGGTKTELALAQVSAAGVELSHVRRYASAQAASLGAIVRGYLDELRETEALGDGAGAACELAALAVAGPVHAGRCKTTNLAWELDAEALAAELGLPEVTLLNDLEAIAWAVPGLGDDDLLALHRHRPHTDAGRLPANACVIAAGTGLGVAGLHWDGRGHRPFATEAGHVEFAPTNELEFALTRRLRARYGRVSWERLVSGPGIVALFEFLLAWRGAGRPSGWSGLGEAELAAMIAQAAQEGREPVCVATMDLFARLFARFIGDLVLAQMAVGGVYLAGGVTLSNLWLLRGPGFVDGVFAKGRMDAVVRRAPICVITRQDVALIGAGRFAFARGGPGS